MIKKMNLNIDFKSHIESEINRIKSSTDNLKIRNKDVVTLFSFISESKDISFFILDKIFDTALSNKEKTNTDFLNSLLPLIKSKPDIFLTWYCQKVIHPQKENLDQYIGKNIILIKKIQKKDLIYKIINENLDFLSEFQFKEKLLKPLMNINRAQNLTPESFTVMLFYLNKYKNGMNDFYEQITEYDEESKLLIINRFISKKLFTKKLYEQLPDFAKGLTKENSQLLYNKVFRNEINVEYLKMFEPAFIEMVKHDDIYLEGFSGALNTTQEKRDYILETYSIKENYKNKIINDIMINLMQTQKVKLDSFVKTLLNNHLTGKNHLNEVQFAIIIKRCFDGGCYLIITDLLDELKEKDKITFDKVHKTIHANPIIKIYKEQTIDLSKEPIEKFLHKVFMANLEQDIPEKLNSKKSMKI